MEHGNSTAPLLTPEERRAAAMAIWNHEKGLAAAVIIVTWIFKVYSVHYLPINAFTIFSLQIYFALVIYSYAMHLRKGSYRSLPLSRSIHNSHSTSHTAAYDMLADAEDDDIEGFYRVPLRSPIVRGHRRGTSGNHSSITSFADFVSAPGRPPRKKGLGNSSYPRQNGIHEETVLFDEDEATYAASTSSRGHSKPGTESSSTVINSDEEHIVGGYGP